MGWFVDFVFGKPKEDTVEGKTGSAPAESAQGAPQAPHESAGPEKDQFREVSGTKIVPEVVVDRVESKPSSDTKHLELWIELRNESPFEVEVKKCEVLRQATDPGRFLKPGESYEVKVYQGETPRTDAEKKAIIQYRIVENGDYFQSEHLISYKLETTDTIEYFLPCEMRLIRPVRDI